MKKISIFLIAFSLFFISAKASFAASYFRGINLFGGWQGQFGGVDTFPDTKMLDYYKSKGLVTFRVGFSWLHLQPSLNGPLDANYLAKMDTLVANAKARGEQVAFVPLPGNYNGNDVATSAVPQSAFNDMWTKLAVHYKNETAIWGYDLINEPNMGDSWNTNIAPSVISAIREVDMIHPIIVPTSTGGYGHFFTSHLTGLPMSDPANNLIYEAHFYFDTPPNGQYPNGFDVPGGDLNIGVERAQGFVNWCISNNQKCFAGEYGTPGGWTHGDTSCIYNGGSNNDPRWLTILDNFLTYLDQNGISGTYWESGPYGDINSAGPFCDTNGNYIDAPQMAILTKHVVAPTFSPVPTATPHPTPTPNITPSPVPTPTPVGGIIIDDSVVGSGPNQWNYAGSGWNHCTSCNETNPAVTYYNSSQSWDPNTNDSASLIFTGNQIQFFGVVASWHGIAAVSIDGGAETNVDFYSAAKTGNVLLWTSPVLTNATHTLKLRITGSKNPQSSDKIIVVDRAVVLSSTRQGDANSDGKVDGLDYVVWLTNYNQNVTAGAAKGDFNSDGKVDGLDYVIWLDNY